VYCASLTFYDESVRQSQQAIEMDPNFAVAHYLLGQALEQKHDRPSRRTLI
jgi:TPR repeat